jgi:CRP/FNR family transcriptional regulator, global nitrogen regulator
LKYCVERTERLPERDRRGDQVLAIPTSGGLDPSPVRILRELEESGLRVLERSYGAGEMICAPGDPDDRLYFLLSGAIRTYKTYGDFKEATTALLKDEGIFGGLDFSDATFQEEFVEALTDARVAEVRKAAVAWLVKRRPELAFALFSAFSERRRISEKLIENLLPREVSSRLATLLLNLGERFGEEEGECGGAVVLDLRLTHRELASMIACTREAVSKVMSEFRREGVIGIVGRKRIVLLDRIALCERAGGEARIAVVHRG